MRFAPPWSIAITTGALRLRVAMASTVSCRCQPPANDGASSVASGTPARGTAFGGEREGLRAGGTFEPRPWASRGSAGRSVPGVAGVEREGVEAAEDGPAAAARERDGEGERERADPVAH